MPEKSGELIQGTLDMLILKTLALGSMHGYGIAVRKTEQESDEELSALLELAAEEKMKRGMSSDDTLRAVFMSVNRTFSVVNSYLG